MAPQRLINTTTLDLEEQGETSVRYAILSHRWVDEVTLQEWKYHRGSDGIQKKHGYAKIKEVCRLALSDGFDYVWVDTNCIDKTNLTELSEAINSMFSWYIGAAFCYVYLHDLEDNPEPGAPRELNTSTCEWFTRGWTLQELLASQNMGFYSKNWTYIGSKNDLSRVLSRLTRIDEIYLHDARQISTASAAKRFSCAAGRQTGKPEDVAYCLLGLFDINMPLLYGEGALKAFRRLQEEIIKVSTDQTIFAWEWPEGWEPRSLDWINFFAPNPSAFANSGRHVPASRRPNPWDIYSLTNLGLSIKLLMLETLCVRNEASAFLFARIQCVEGDDKELLYIPVYKNGHICSRIPFPPGPVTLNDLPARFSYQLHASRLHSSLPMPGFLPSFGVASKLRSDITSQHQLYFICMYSSDRGLMLWLGDFEAAHGSEVFPEFGMLVIKPIGDKRPAGGVVAIRRSSKTQESPRDMTVAFLNLGVTFRLGSPSYHCDMNSNVKRNKIAGELDNWTRRLDKISRGKEEPLGRATTREDRGTYLGKPRDIGLSTIIPVYINDKDLEPAN